MEVVDLLKDYSTSDFERALRELLPKGAYWQDANNIELSQLIDAMATDFKATHDDLHLGILITEPDELFGWKLSDYRQLMADHGIEGVVFDTPKEPNLILVAIDAHQPYQKMLKAFEDIKLPHTAFYWLFDVTESMPRQPIYIGGYQCLISQVEVGPRPPQPNVYGELLSAPFITVNEKIEIPLK